MNDINCIVIMQCPVRGTDIIYHVNGSLEITVFIVLLCLRECCDGS